VNISRQKETRSSRKNWAATHKWAQEAGADGRGHLVSAFVHGAAPYDLAWFLEQWFTRRDASQSHIGR